MGTLPLFGVRDHAQKMPEGMAKKGGVFFPMYQREATWTDSFATAPFAIEIYVGGVNAVSGFPVTEKDKTRERRPKMLGSGQPIQDSVAVPAQIWLDVRKLISDEFDIPVLGMVLSGDGDHAAFGGSKGSLFDVSGDTKPGGAYFPPKFSTLSVRISPRCANLARGIGSPWLFRLAVAPPEIAETDGGRASQGRGQGRRGGGGGGGERAGAGGAAGHFESTFRPVDFLREELEGLGLDG
ncbi:hypothetical protein LY76DRAFT_632129 [Colletotrichum caudatum]|nr:hypothetical protein LY76DRAFT_632129 [Colletotrichum caudatum]